MDKETALVRKDWQMDLSQSRVLWHSSPWIPLKSLHPALGRNQFLPRQICQSETATKQQSPASKAFIRWKFCFHCRGSKQLWPITQRVPQRCPPPETPPPAPPKSRNRGHKDFRDFRFLQLKVIPPAKKKHIWTYLKNYMFVDLRNDFRNIDLGGCQISATKRWCNRRSA
jgi:hypothetical protein